MCRLWSVAIHTNWKIEVYPLPTEWYWYSTNAAIKLWTMWWSDILSTIVILQWLKLIMWRYLAQTDKLWKGWPLWNLYLDFYEKLQSQWEQIPWLQPEPFRTLQEHQKSRTSEQQNTTCGIQLTRRIRLKWSKFFWFGAGMERESIKVVWVQRFLATKHFKHNFMGEMLCFWRNH